MKALVLSLAALLATPALAHTGAGATDGLMAGFLHPALGLDHVLAMVAVGLWAGLVGGRAVLAWPAAFVALMVGGALLGMGGMPLPGVEGGIAISVVALGLAVALRAPLPLAAGAAVCGLFAIFHGHAHGAELPEGAGAAAYVVGFALSTTFLHAAGVALGLVLTRVPFAWAPRLAGGAVAATGLLLLVG